MKTWLSDEIDEMMIFWYIVQRETKQLDALCAIPASQ